MPEYDPDAAPFDPARLEELPDEESNELASRWFDDPNTVALVDDLSRQLERFRPASSFPSCAWNSRRWRPALQS
jgi:hypothetical protein